jgi:hypothetical protein
MKKLKLLTFGALTTALVFFLLQKQRFKDWTLSPSSGKRLLSWAQLKELVSISGGRD